jgi:hypothetical protein
LYGCHPREASTSSIGSAERGDVKHLKSRETFNLGSDRLEKRAVLYSGSRIQEDRLMQIEMENN